MVQNESLAQVLEKLIQRNLGEAIEAMTIFLSVHPHQINSDRLFAINADYQLMTDYWRRGFKDPQLPHLYDNLLRRMYVLYANIIKNYEVRHSHDLSMMFYQSRMSSRDWSPQVLKEGLEAFVSEMALLGLEPRHTSNVKRKELIARHHQWMTELFDYILTSDLWTDGLASAMEEILLSPTVDTNDQQIIVSSMMLSMLNCFDICKFRTLVHVYQQAADEHVRQRALVGWVFSLDSAIGRSIYPEEVQLVEKLLEDETCCQELVELQKQMVYCVDAEQDNRTIQQEIMPDLLKHQGFRITRNGIEEQEEDPLRDILHPDEEEKNLEKVEESFQRMMEMQKQGSDIYFAGFSQMKRFPFFNDMINWLMPFSKEHPGLAPAMEKLGNNKFVDVILNSGPFCNSDKFSFVLAFEQVVLKVPKEMQELLNKGEAAIYQMNNDSLDQPTYIRRTYLQDLYRFFRLAPQNNIYKPVFDVQAMNHLFFAEELFSATHLERYFNELTAFLIKKKHYPEAKRMIGNYGEFRRDFEYYMMAGYLGVDPKDNYAKAVKLQPNNERALVGYARALFAENSYQEALAVYDQLLELQPEKKSYLLNKAVCLTNLARYGEAEKLLFRLNYESPEDMNVSRVLAWSLTCDGKYEQAEKLYQQLLSVEKPLSEDILNDGYCLWFSGAIDDAADCFHRYLKETGHEKRFIINEQLKRRGQFIINEQ